MSASTTPEQFVEAVSIDAPVACVWASLASTRCMEEWMGEADMDVRVTTHWRVGSPFLVRGIHHVPFENQGKVLALEPLKRLAYSHRSSLSLLPDDARSYTTLDFSLAANGDRTGLTLTGTGFPTPSIYHHLRFYWRGTLDVFKHYVERRYKPR